MQIAELSTKFSFNGSLDPLLRLNKGLDIATVSGSTTTKTIQKTSSAISHLNREIDDGAKSENRLAQSSISLSKRLSSLTSLIKFKTLDGFKSDIDDSRKEIDELDNFIDIDRDINLKVNSSGVDESGSKFTRLSDNIRGVIGAVSLASVALGGLVVASIAGTDAQIQLARETGVAVEAIQELGYVASVNGSGAEEMQRSLSNLSKKMGEAVVENNETTKAFQRLGIALKDNNGEMKSADDMMMELSSRFKELNLSSQEQKAYLEKLGLDESMLQTLQLGADGIDELRKKARAMGVASTKDANEIASFNDSLTTLKYSIGGITRSVALGFVPQLKGLSDSFSELLIKNSDVVKKGLSKFIGAIGTGLSAVVKFGKGLYSLIDNTIGINTALGITAVAFARLNKTMLLNPVSLIIAGIVGVIAIFDDLSVALNGGKSKIAEWSKAWFDIDIVEALNKIWLDVSGWSSKVVKEFKPFFDVVNEINNYKFNFSDLKKAGEQIGIYYSGISTSINTFFDNSASYVKNLVDKNIHYFDPIFSIFDKITSFKMPNFGSPFDGFEMPSLSGVFSSKKRPQENSGSNGVVGSTTIHNNTNISQNGIDARKLNASIEKLYRNAPISPTRIVEKPNVTTNTTHVTNSIKVDVKSSDPVVAGQSVASELDKMLRNASVNFSKNGGM